MFNKFFVICHPSHCFFVFVFYLSIVYVVYTQSWSGAENVKSEFDIK